MPINMRAVERAGRDFFPFCDRPCQGPSPCPSPARGEGTNTAVTAARRQALIGPYIVAFFHPQHRLIVEVDGGQHGNDADAARDA
jgi:hypothetical protein